ncbi:hypothetical protein [Bradyrhizobium elkanii]|nr:hypothetical protein [Bradyrhizobium elkanii]MCW2192867.1 hypothetical protein [Bradyrhizobium elkanii]MCW2211808.1 hypothetical protein [Bradyrhizobium elkanii]NWL66820.1 hypothetical protein [Bradyrhizobium elkanii]
METVFIKKDMRPKRVIQKLPERNRREEVGAFLAVRLVLRFDINLQEWKWIFSSSQKIQGLRGGILIDWNGSTAAGSTARYMRPFVFGLLLSLVEK